jgi:hypothetical protein
MVRCDPPGRVEVRYGLLSLSEAMEQRAFFDQGVLLL